MLQSKEFQVDDLVYVPCEGKAPFLRGRVQALREDEVLVVQTEHATITAASTELRRCFDGDVCQDNTSLVYLNDATILQNLKARHQADDIYTYTASVLLAVNPYHDIEGLYGPEQCARYRGKHIGALPPHPYAIADAAYRALVREHRNQGFIISGESGAGKTETAKIVMQYLGYVSGSSNNITAQIQQRILQAQPILESFGNAVTMRNNNSSRFGKYKRFFFDETGTLMDAGVTTYLLESSRVVMHSSSERTYHCFYEMLSGLPKEKLLRWHLEPTKRKRHLLLASDAEDTDEKWHGEFQERDAKNFRRLCDALAVVGFSQDDMDSTFQVLAGLVHLGDLSLAERDEGDETSTVQLDEEILAKAAGLLGMDATELAGALRRRKVRVTHPGRESLHEVPRTTAQFRHALHSLIKALYKRLFERLVFRINGSFQELQAARGHCEEELREIGILDIYGFERLQRNSFEQLCINLANERLQQYFVENVLVAEEALYRREGLPWYGLQLPDSTPVVSAISQTFRILDECSQQLAKGFEKTDESFCQKTVDEAQKDPERRELLRAPRTSKKRPTLMNEGFVVKHYAGQVEYSTKGWLDKNNDRLLPECEELICDSTFELVASLKDDDQGKAPFRSISKKYCTDLEHLLQTLSTCQLHYIRCFKPNDFQQAAVFDEQLVLDQIVQCGTVELVKIMHDGYPNRCRFQEMLRFRDLLPESFQRYGTRTFIEALLLAYNVPKEDWALGTSRLFLRAGQLKALEDLRSAGAAPDPVRLQQIVRRIIRAKWLRAAHAVRLCLYVPRFLSAVRAKRAEETLATRALLMGRLRLQLDRARCRLREKHRRALRRWRVAMHVVRLTGSWMAQAQARRLQKAMRKFWRLRTRLPEWVALKAEEARLEEERRRAEEEARLEEERRREEHEAKLEEERRRAEEEAKLEEERRMAEEEARLEEERKRAEEEARLEERRRAEEEARLEEEQRREEEEARLQEERRRVEEEARLEEEHRRAEEEAAECRMAEEEARQEDERGRAVKEARWEEERRMAQARELEEHRRAAEEQAEFEPIPDEESKFRQSEEKERRPSIKDVPSPCRSSQRHLPGEPEVTEDGWSNISPDLNSRQNLIDFLALRCKQVETEMQKKQTEIQNDMNDLLKRHEMMESRLNSSYQPQGQLALALAPMSPESLQHRPSVGRAAHTPSSVYQEKRRHSILVDDRQNWQEQRAFIMEDLQKTSTPSRLSPPSPRTEEKNRCIKTFKKCTQIDGSKSRSPGTPVKDEELQLQRQWWAQQRRALFKETQLSCESEDPRTRAFPARYTRVVRRRARLDERCGAVFGAQSCKLKRLQSI
ncbi:unnamed protein product [Durusdinium trenchii]|uniref:Myosin motor domain-containing protein n=1 Tax=Durusdinium trenchii TaxID=1381693 RepID=A0ABP0HY46_9DINO